MPAIRRFGVAAPVLVALGGVAILLFAATAAGAQSPFGVGTPDVPAGLSWAGPLAPVFQWIAVRQAAFYRSLTGALSSMKENGGAFWLLAGLSFAYGVLHAVGPGHGKAVIAAYLVSTGEWLKRGVAISFAAALVQGFVAIGLVAVAAGVLNVTAMTMTAATDWLEIASYALIAAIGLALLVRRVWGDGHDHAHHAHANDNAGHHHHNDDGHRAHHHDHAHHHHDHGHDDHHGHLHAPPPELVARPLTLRRAGAAIAAMGVRPCSGAIIVLVFALSQGLFLAGAASALVMAVGTGLTVAAIAVLTVSARGVAVRMAGEGSGAAMRIANGLGILGALALMALGLLLLGGKLAAGV